MFNAEAFAAAPKAGKYTVTVRPIEATDASFRLRARLEAAPAKASSKVVPLLPNLRTVPPVELGFVAPVTPNGSYPPDKANPPAEVLGTPLYSCTQDESAPAEAGGAGAIDCLRLTSGPMNVGAGPFDMRFTFVDDLVDGSADPALLRGPIFQAVHYSNGTTQMRPAGSVHLPHDPCPLPRREHPQLRPVPGDRCEAGPSGAGGDGHEVRLLSGRPALR